MKEVPYNQLLKREGQRYALKDEAFYKLLDELRLQAGGQWKDIAREARISTRHFRRVRGEQYPTVSIHVMDKILSRMGFPHRVQELRWYTPNELVEMGVWKPHNISGLQETNRRRKAAKERRRKAA
jgi:hypothetical protein